MSDYMTLVYDEIEAVVRQSQRDLRRGVLPKDVRLRLPYLRAEGSLRRDMALMQVTGRLVRVGGKDARRGYRLPTPVERLAWQLNRGMWPPGAENVMAWVH